MSRSVGPGYRILVARQVVFVNVTKEIVYRHAVWCLTFSSFPFPSPLFMLISHCNTSKLVLLIRLGLLLLLNLLRLLNLLLLSLLQNLSLDGDLDVAQVLAAVGLGVLGRVGDDAAVDELAAVLGQVEEGLCRRRSVSTPQATNQRPELCTHPRSRSPPPQTSAAPHTAPQAQTP